MTYYFFPMTEKEAAKPANLGYVFALKNKSRWVENADLGIERNTYDRGVSKQVYNGIVYIIHSDFHDMTNNLRVFIGTPALEARDKVI